MPSSHAGARPRPALVRGGAALAALAVLAGCAGGTEIQTGSQDDRYIAGDGTGTSFAPEERQAAPDVSGRTLAGDEVSLQDYRGEIVVMNLWASWCGPCRAEKPVLDEVYGEYSDRGVDFLGVNIKDDATAAQAFERNLEVPYPSLYDQPGAVPQAFRGTVPPRAIPSTLVIDPEGRIAARVIGPTTYPQLTGLLDPLVDELDESA